MQIDHFARVDPAEPKQEALLEAAVGVFARYEFRKTSMDEVARTLSDSQSQWTPPKRFVH